MKAVESKKRDAEAQLDKIMMDKKMVLNNRTGKLEAATFDTTKARLTSGFKLEDIPDYEKAAKEKMTPL